jgi:uncharacterized protein (DUF305 family)
MKRILAPSLVLATALTLSACSGSDAPGTQEGEGFNNADMMFAQMMVPHHEQAIDMSDLILAEDGVDSQITDLATQIKEAQGREIEQPTTWLDEWGAPDPDSMGMDHGSRGDGPMDGMMSEDDMQALEDAEGAEAGRLFLEQMIDHHEGAIEMAQTEVDNGDHEGAVEMAGNIVSSQTSEIETMEGLLAGIDVEQTSARMGE